jgi:hypothetical protein
LILQSARVLANHNLGEGGVKIDVAKCGIGFQGSLYLALLAPLLPDEHARFYSTA